MNATLRRSMPAATSSRCVAQQQHRRTAFRRSPATVVRAYDVDVESERAKAPDTPPRWGGSPPPPPPPPPPPSNKGFLGNFQLPNGRDILIGALGAGIGVAGMWLFYETSVPEFTDEELEAILAEEAINRALEGDTDFLSALDQAISISFPDELLDAAVSAARESQAAQK